MFQRHTYGIHAGCDKRQFIVFRYRLSSWNDFFPIKFSFLVRIGTKLTIIWKKEINNLYQYAKFWTLIESKRDNFAKEIICHNENGMI